MKKFQSLRQVFKITEWRAGCIYKTKPVGYAWVTLDKENIPNNDGNLMLASISTEISKRLGNKTIRRVDDSTPDFEITTLSELGDSK